MRKEKRRAFKVQILTHPSSSQSPSKGRILSGVQEHMQNLFRCVTVAACVASGSVAFAGELKLSIANGRATLIATDVPVRQILAEWARIGETKILNGERVIAPNLTVQLIDRPEREVLDAVLRTVAGYVAAPRSEMAGNLSVFDRILILPTSQPPAFNPAAMATPTFTRPPTPIIPEDDPVEQPNVVPPGVANMPQPPGAAPQMPQVLPRPGMPQTQQPQTLPVPGMLPPPAPTAVPNPYAPNPANPFIRPPTPPTTGRGGGPGGGQ